MSKIRSSFVVVVGLGGVGSHAAHMLIRSGIERIRLIDFDQVTLSSLNRHAVANQSDVGIPKVIALQRHFRKIMPHVDVDARIALFNRSDANELLEGNPDFVIDAIDNMNTKLDLIQICVERNIPLISSMGAGAKSDPSRVQIADISETYEDPLARATRAKLKKRGILSGVPVVYSSEKPGVVKAVPLTEKQLEDPSAYSSLPDFRVSIIPVLGTLPAVFGCFLASHVITELAGWPTRPIGVTFGKAKFEKLYRDFCNRERSNGETKITLSIGDIAYIVEDVFRGKSVISSSVEKLVVTRWKLNDPGIITNVIVCTKDEADRHVELGESGHMQYSNEVKDRFKTAVATIESEMEWR